MQSAIGHFINRWLSRGWNSWAEMRADSHHVQSALYRGASHMANGCLSRGWNAWVDCAASRANTVVVLRKGLGHFVHRQVALGLAGWKYSIELAQGRVRTSYKLRHALKRMTKLHEARAVASWKHACDEEERRRTSLRRSFRFWKHAEFAKSWNQWADLQKEHADFLLKIRQASAMLVHREAAMHLAVWRHFVQRSQLVARGLAFLFSRELSRGWTQWLGWWAMHAELAAAMQRGNDHAMASFIRSNGFTMGSVALAHFTNRELSRGWNTWLSVWQERASTHAILLQAVSHMGARHASRGWNAWVEMAVEHAAFYRKLYSSVKYMVKRKEAVAMGSWKAHCAWQQKLLSCGPGVFMHREKAKGWNAWVLAVGAHHAPPAALSNAPAAPRTHSCPPAASRHAG